jgi:hypothetical protein
MAVTSERANISKLNNRSAYWNNKCKSKTEAERKFYLGEKMKMIIPALLLSSSFVFGEINKSGVKAATSRAEFCKQAENPDYFKSLFYSRSNQLSFTNGGGLLNGGVCWWHSMLTRTVQYLTVYKPELPKPDRTQANKIIGWLVSSQGVVEIPGYRNFSEFSYDHADLIQAALEGWQIVDGSIGLGFLRGLMGSHQVDSQKLSSMMDDTYKLVNGKKRVAYQKLQVEGVTAHAWLVIDMNKTANGYTLDVVDSNYSGVSTIIYTRGMTQLSQYNAVPYTSRNRMDQSSYEHGIMQYCSRGMTAADLDQTGKDY